MKCNLSTLLCDGFLTALLVLGGAASAYAQSAPELREILNRLDRLEKDNQALTEEIRALRQDLAVRRSGNPEAVASATPSGGQSTDGQAVTPEPQPTGRVWTSA